MPYTQRFGLSRLSPLNSTEEKVPSQELFDEANKPVDSTYDVASEMIAEPATEIIENNNNKSTQAGLGGGAGKFFSKEAVKQGLKKYISPMAGKIFGVAATMLSTTPAYGGQDTSITGRHEKQLQYGGGNLNEPHMKESKAFFDNQFSNFDNQSDWQQGRLKYLNKKYNLGYLKDRLQPSSDVEADEW
jgi:hypothetical protein